MPRIFRISIVTGLVFACALLVSCQNGGSNGAAQAANAASQPGNTAADSNANNTTAQVTIPGGTVLEVRIAERLGSADSSSGETFHATVARPVEQSGEIVIHRGADVTGRVVFARPSGHLKTPAELAVELTSISVDGQSYPLATRERAWRGRSHKGHDAKWIAGLAGGGALLGALVGHGQGAAIGAGVGAGAGTATAYATGKKDIYLPSETELRFVLREPLTIYTAG